MAVSANCALDSLFSLCTRPPVFGESDYRKSMPAVSGSPAAAVADETHRNANRGELGGTNGIVIGSAGSHPRRRVAMCR